MTSSEVAASVTCRFSEMKVGEHPNDNANLCCGRTQTLECYRQTNNVLAILWLLVASLDAREYRHTVCLDAALGVDVLVATHALVRIEPTP